LLPVRAPAHPRWAEGGTKYPQPYNSFWRQAEATRGYVGSQRLGGISIPTLIVHGKGDRMATPEFAEQTHSGIPGSKLVFLDWGHLIVFRSSAPMVSAFDEFLLGS
jgi:pimeloyl-ACP methyl ester carboxylesterase